MKPHGLQISGAWMKSSLSAAWCQPFSCSMQFGKPHSLGCSHVALRRWSSVGSEQSLVCRLLGWHHRDVSGLFWNAVAGKFHITRVRGSTRTIAWAHFQNYGVMLDVSDYIDWLYYLEVIAVLTTFLCIQTSFGPFRGCSHPSLT